MRLLPIAASGWESDPEVDGALRRCLETSERDIRAADLVHGTVDHVGVQRVKPIDDSMIRWMNPVR
jgi:hypothetical protein